MNKKVIKDEQKNEYFVIKCVNKSAFSKVYLCELKHNFENKYCIIKKISLKS